MWRCVGGVEECGERGKVCGGRVEGCGRDPFHGQAGWDGLNR